MEQAPGAAKGRPLLLAVAVGLVLADSSVVTLALPAILREFDSGVGEVTWVLIAFNLALALAALPCARLARGRSAFVISTIGFAAASLACAAAPSLDALIAARATQGVLGAAVVAAALALLLRALPRRRAIGLWAAAGVLGAAIGPAAGGVLTEAFSWQTMFALQAPLALIALLGAGAAPGRILPAGGRTTAGQDESPVRRVASLLSLTLVSAALAAALFLLVVMLIEGWRRSPGEAALIVTALPLAALVGGRWARDERRLGPALPGCVLLAGGLAALGLLPETGAAWTIAPQLAIGAGLGLALGALIGVTVAAGGEGAVAHSAAWTIAARHAGIVAGLLILTPILQADLDGEREPAERAGLARVLDAPVDLRPKIALARALDREIAGAADQQLPDLAAAFAAAGLPASERAGAAILRGQLERELDSAATAAFSRSFLVAALLALLAAGVLAPAVALERGRSSTVFTLTAAAVATLLVGAHVALGGREYGPTEVADPCAARVRPAGVDRTQLALLATLDGGACELRLPREDLLLTLIGGRNPAGISDAELGEALGTGIDRAQKEGAVPGFAATLLRLALKTGGPTALIGRLLDG